MTHVLIEEHPRIDAADMRFLIDLVSEDNFEVDSVPQDTARKSVWWIMIFHWVADDASHLTFDAALTALALKIRKHFSAKGKTPPHRIDVKDRDGQVIFSVEISEPEKGESDTDVP